VDSFRIARETLVTSRTSRDPGTAAFFAARAYRSCCSLGQCSAVQSILGTD